MKVQSTLHPDFISKTVNLLLNKLIYNQKMTKLLIFDAFQLLICKKKVTNCVILWCKTFCLKIWLCIILDKYHVWTNLTSAPTIGSRYHTAISNQVLLGYSICMPDFSSWNLPCLISFKSLFLFRITCCLYLDNWICKLFVFCCGRLQILQ